MLFLIVPRRLAAQDTRHPLDPLTKAEIEKAVNDLRKVFRGETTRLWMMHLHEPPKEAVLAWRPGKTIPREAFAILYDRASNSTFEAIDDLATGKVAWKKVPGAQPGYLLEDQTAINQVVRNDPRWLEAMRKRGIKDLDEMQIFAYPIGGYAPAKRDESRYAIIVTGHSWRKQVGAVQGLTILANLSKKEIVQFEDHGDTTPALARENYFDPKDLPAPRFGQKPMKTVRPNGVSFEVRGHEVRWQNWRFRVGLHPRVGLVLYAVGYQEGGKLRSILYRASLSELVVPYGDPGWMYWNVFDAGDYGLGSYARSPLTPNNDAPEHAHYFNFWTHDQTGLPIEVPRAVAVYERDGGLLWRHASESRRARELVVSSFALADNYDYGFNWIFHQDGTLECEVLLTGIMNYKTVARAKDSGSHLGKPTHGHLVAANVEAPHHQHFFNFRLDLDVDGAANNSLVEMNTAATPVGPDNPRGFGFAMTETLLANEHDARRNLNLATSRKWKVINPTKKNALGQPVGYALVPGENAVPYAAADSFLRKHAGFVNAHVWATPYEPRELYAAGDYTNLSQPGDGLPKWTAANRSLEGQDLVLWYTLGVTHLPRPEEWPVMTAHRAGFKLVPAGFFSGNPALDVPAR